MTEQLDIAMDDEQDQSTDSGLCDDPDGALCDDPDKCPITMCGCRWLQTGDAWSDKNESEG